ncbi:MAG: ribonuclease H-like YkuK family protein [Bacillota bacterium]|nr:ribonuclease H-like YkuK family protein [Bacillota bacterium]
MRSMSYGEIDFNRMVQLISNYVNQESNRDYQISVGTDSQNFDLTKTVIVVAVNRIGNGGIFFYDIKRVKKITNIRQKIFYETNLSLELATKLEERLKRENLNYNITIHVDAGNNGPSSMVIPEITAWINSCGFACKTKPDSYAASCIANRYSK